MGRMKTLLSKTTKPLLVYMFIILIISIPVYYFVIDHMWKGELDTHNRLIAERTAGGLNSLKLSDSEQDATIALWNRIQPGTVIQTSAGSRHLPDSIFTIYKPIPFASDEALNRFRCLAKTVSINRRIYRITVETNIEESGAIVNAIVLNTLFFIVLLIVGFLILNRKLSGTAWRPFRETLRKLKGFNLHKQTPIDFEKTDTVEFEELNTALRELIDHTIAEYKLQKEFTENASHEMQTPLAILKNKLDVLLQKEMLTGRQYAIVEEMHKTLAHSARINKNLLLLAKIENRQFDSNQRVNISNVLWQIIDTLTEHLERKHIVLQPDIATDVLVTGNEILTEILINNLLVNVTRYTSETGTAFIKLTPHYLEIINSGTVPLNSNLLFRRFSKLSAEHGGSGLGLAIVAEICKRQQWRISYRFGEGRHIFSICF
jgi:signal transduction histidine kinase